MDESWLDIAKGLDEGRSTRHNHCSDSKSAVVSNREWNWGIHCFRCGHTASYRKPNKTLNEIMAAQPESFKDLESMPDDFVLLPPNKAEWVLKYGIDLDTAHFYGIGYSSKFDRIILPVGSYHTPEFIQGRSMREDQKPKYLTTGGAKAARALFKNEMVQQDSERIVLTEDILSAIKIGLAGYAAISILGTGLTDGKIQRLLELSCRAYYVWMDGDAPGQSAATKIVNRLQIVGAQAVRVRSKFDPKVYERDQISAFLDNANSFEYGV